MITKNLKGKFLIILKVAVYINFSESDDKTMIKNRKRKLSKISKGRKENKKVNKTKLKDIKKNNEENGEEKENELADETKTNEEEDGDTLNKESENGEHEHDDKFVYGNDKGPCACNICGKVISNKYGLREHQSVVHFKNGKFQCEICGKRVTNKRALNLHMTSHSTER